MTIATATAPYDLERFRATAAICRALTDPKRLALLHLLRDGERSAGALAGALGCTLANASQHLAVLRHAGLVASRREGTSVLYRLAAPEILDACDAVGRLAAAQGAGATDRPRES
ncbi:MAG TPA: metalloregulator ArsR/SmtB family transcription factor [Candidatus Limnocylindria bacterium]|nr:metalloregulator ArsR/SmtB family transcription factor [Candidatus Limnocylindria bacterium]